MRLSTAGRVLLIVLGLLLVYAGWADQQFLVLAVGALLAVVGLLSPSTWRQIAQGVDDGWRGVTRRAKLEIAGAVLFALPLVLLFALTTRSESSEFALRILIGQADPFAENSGWAAQSLSILTVFLLPILMGSAIAFVFAYLAAEVIPTEAEIEAIVRDKIEEIRPNPILDEDTEEGNTR